MVSAENVSIVASQLLRAWRYSCCAWSAWNAYVELGGSQPFCLTAIQGWLRQRHRAARGEPDAERADGTAERIIHRRHVHNHIHELGDTLGVDRLQTLRIIGVGLLQGVLESDMRVVLPLRR